MNLSAGFSDIPEQEGDQNTSKLRQAELVVSAL